MDLDIVVGTQSDAKRRGPCLPPANPLPQRERSNHIGLQLIVIVSPQQLEIGVIEERASVRGALASVDAPPGKLESKISQHILGRSRIIGTDEDVIDDRGH